MLSPVTHILPVTLIRRTRLLPVPGKIVVRKGQKVNAADTVGEARLSPAHILLDLARGLGLQQNKADEFLQVKAGDNLSEGDIIAGPVGIARRVVRAPRDGRVVVAGGGQVLVEVDSRPFELKAGIPGVVVELISDHGVQIETTGALIQGVWGNGRIDAGLLTPAIRSPEQEITADKLDVSQRGGIILGGYCKNADVLTTAAEIPMRGMILASMDSSLLSVAAKMPFPVIVLEGFGHIPMNPSAYKLLSSNDRREVVLKAEAWDRIADIRPEIIIPLPTSSQVPLPKETDTFAPGQQVRVVLGPQHSKVGKIVALRPGLATLPSGIKALSAEVRLESGENAVFALANLEVLQ